MATNENGKQYIVIKKIPVRQAMGLVSGKPDLQIVLERMFARGYLVLHIFNVDGLLGVVFERQFEVAEEKPTINSDPDSEPVRANVYGAAEALDNMVKAHQGNGKAQAQPPKDLGEPEIVTNG